MWTKIYANGTILEENRNLNLTWRKTPNTGIIKVILRCRGIHDGMISRSLEGHREYWHSRTAVANEACKPIIIAERIQGLLPDGTWETITWNGTNFINSIETRAFGKLILK